ncbi:MAG TPA: response regulator [Anaerolineae bacterium]|nr:response regulator [Anaerolineae bacterium]
MTSERILVAEDSREVAAFLQGYLVQQGYEVQVVYDGETAVRVFTARPFDLVLTDLQMPRLDGLGVLHHVKERSKDTQVIILTGHASLDSALDALRHGAYDYLLKPVDHVDQLRFTINRALQQRRLELENRRLLQKLQEANTHLEQRVAEQTHELREAYELLKRVRRHADNARLATGLLHQINNAVANIPELVEELESLKWSEAATAPLNELRLNAHAVAHVRDWLYQFVKIGNLSLDPVDLVSLTSQTIHRLENRRPPHVRVVGPHAPGLVPPIQADRELIGILVDNLLQNAFEAIPPTRKGFVGVWIKPEAEYCILGIRDNGVGIRPEDREQIWEWGWTTKREVRDKVHDRGLGLYASREIAFAHGGALELENSGPNDGAAFVVRLPVAGPRLVSER